ncbi:unnamed protein product [marine sediment metagenome]|uniref:Uncharacterized protein n=1 Tax=marine sediment metagenome TaxID=412755 RepID=X0SAZ5_9ZZZZ
MNRKKAKAKVKPKPKRQWQLKGWVAMPTEDLVCLKDNTDGPIVLGEACRRFLCGHTADTLRSALGLHGRKDVAYAILRLDITATAR